MTPESGFAMVDQDGSGDVDAEEGFEALYCMVEWGMMSEEEAWFLYDFLGAHADYNPDGNPETVDFGEAMHALEMAESIHHENDKREEEGGRPLPFPAPDCPPRFPELDNEDFGAEDAFMLID